jgi:two-component system, chemotaxis family, chemotaxis protein CheY
MEPRHSPVLQVALKERGLPPRRTKDSRKILVVDDDPDWRAYLRDCLEDLGYESVEAASGAEALDSLAREDCAVMLLDLHMPEMSGEQVLERLPRDRPPVVFLTSAPVQEVGSALSQGPHYYLPKAATRDQLSLMLQSLQFQ